MMHYSAEHFMDISTERLYQRIVVEHQGSYCFGLNTFFFQMLCGLGYRAYTGSARVNHAKEASDTPIYTGLSHMIIFVQPGEESNVTYLVDVGFGGSGLTRPICLSSSEDNIVMGATPTEQHRLTRDAHPDSRLKVVISSNTTMSGLLWGMNGRPPFAPAMASLSTTPQPTHAEGHPFGMGQQVPKHIPPPQKGLHLHFVSRPIP
ncbi:Arylamine N-acetyltransferase [Termitomyces sp. J132]|nr:Arylamine N-acetyltransferase [Termitomyces sp. J132]